MADKKKFSLIRSVVRMFSLLPLFSSVFTKTLHIVESETRIAGKKLVLLLIYGVILGFLIAYIWFCLLAMLLVYFIQLQMGLLAALSIILILNVLLLIIVGLLILNVKKEKLFPRSRNLLFHLKD